MLCAHNTPLLEYCSLLMHTLNDEHYKLRYVFLDISYATRQGLGNMDALGRGINKNSAVTLLSLEGLKLSGSTPSLLGKK